MSKSATPAWILSDEYGVGTDAFNWILYRRSNRKNGTPGDWTPAGYWSTPKTLLLGLYEKLILTEPPDKDLLAHLERQSSAVRAAAARLSDELNRMAWAGLTRPTANRKQGISL
jgi:hypothetical protein